MLDNFRDGIQRDSTGHIRKDLPFHGGNLAIVRGVPCRFQLIGGIELGDRLNQLLRIVGEILKDVQVPAQQVHCNAVLITDRLQEFRDFEALVALEVEWRVELIEEHHSGAG